ncbi:MAG: hypothetical protein IJY93_02660 [Clostridia bacterium]|nr:hypothetical protein [Clostridia bacterium]
MSKLKIYGMVTAVLLLAAALFARFTDEATAANYVLPLMSLAMVILSVIDIIAYRKDKREGREPGITALIRIISLIVIALLLITATVINLVL